MNSFKNSRKMGLTSFYHNFNTFFRSMLRTEIRRFMNTCNDSFDVSGFYCVPIQSFASGSSLISNGICSTYKSTINYVTILENVI